MATNTERSKRNVFPTLPKPSLPTRESFEIDYEFTDTALEKHGLILTQTINYKKIQSYDTLHIHEDCYDLHIETENSRYTIPCITQEFLQEFKTHVPEITQNKNLTTLDTIAY